MNKCIGHSNHRTKRMFHAPTVTLSLCCDLQHTHLVEMRMSHTPLVVKVNSLSSRLLLFKCFRSARSREAGTRNDPMMPTILHSAEYLSGLLHGSDLATKGACGQVVDGIAFASMVSKAGCWRWPI